MKTLKSLMPLRHKRPVIFAPIEAEYKGKYVHIPELGVHIKIAYTSSLKDWIIRYCKNEPMMKTMLYANYNIQDDV